MNRLHLAFLVAGLMTLAATSDAAAHGERAQEGFLRMETVAFRNVTFSSNAVTPGQDLTISGTATILDSWPETLADPKVGYVNVEAPGPVMLMKDRTVNGMPAPDAIFIRKGDTYQFSMRLEARRPGRWHIHPTFAIEGAGTLIGPGAWITVQDTGSGQFVNSLDMLNGQTIDLESYNLGQLTFWHWLGLALGLGWVLYWIISRPTVRRLAVTSQIPLGSDGHEVGLVTRRDQRVAAWFAIATVAMLAGGWLYQQVYFPVKLPQQVERAQPPDLPSVSTFAQVQVEHATYDPASSTLGMDVRATNSGSRPMTLLYFTTSTLTFFNTAIAEASGLAHYLELDSAAPIAAGETRMMHLTLQDSVWSDEQLIQIDKPRLEVAGELVFTDTGGAENALVVQSRVTPKLY